LVRHKQKKIHLIPEVQSRLLRNDASAGKDLNTEEEKGRLRRKWGLDVGVPTRDIACEGMVQETDLGKRVRTQKNKRKRETQQQEKEIFRKEKKSTNKKLFKWKKSSKSLAEENRSRGRYRRRKYAPGEQEGRII